jgi:hypothetical protein
MDRDGREVLERREEMRIQETAIMPLDRELCVDAGDLGLPVGEWPMELEVVGDSGVKVFT